MPYYGDGAPYYYGGPFANHSSLMTGVARYHNPIAARYSPHLSTISETPLIVLRRYSPAASTTTATTSTLSRPRRIIDTADIDVSKPPRTLAQDNRQQRRRLRRDRPTIKIRCQALKDNPALREYNERHEKTVGELLVEKFLIKDKQSEESERKMKLYHQASLMDQTPSAKERENDILTAIRRRVTRRMTRRRSSADVIPLDPEQLEREAAFHAAQAEALDSLVAEEQAEIEVEMRKGTFAKKQTMRLPLEISEVSETEEDDEMEEEARMKDTALKHTVKKKKRKRIVDDAPFSKSDDDELLTSESIIEEEEFEWDDREKCDDVRKVIPDISIHEKASEHFNHSKLTKAKVNDSNKINVAVEEDKTDLDKTVEKEGTPKTRKNEKKTNRIHDTKIKEPHADDVNKATKEEKITKNETYIVLKDKKRIPATKEILKNEDKTAHGARDSTSKTELNRLKRTISTPITEMHKNDVAAPTFKIEACNSVGDFSTLYVKAANATPPPVRTVEQFRESVRLPAPRKGGTTGITNIETKIILPVRKPYIRDTSRNSVYLALKPSQNIRHGQVGADDSSSIVIGEMRKESNTEDGASIDSRLAKCRVIGTDRSQTRHDLIINEETNVVTNSDTIVCPPATIERSIANESKIRDNKTEILDAVVNENIKSSFKRNKGEFVAWWDEIDETPSTNLEKQDIKVKGNDISENVQQKVKLPTEEQIGISVDSVKVKDKSEKSVISELKERSTDKTVEVKEKVTKSEFKIDIQEENLKHDNVQQKLQNLPKVLNKEEQEKIDSKFKKIIVSPPIDTNISKEPISPKVKVKNQLAVSKSKTNGTSETRNNKSIFANEETNHSVKALKKSEERLIKPNLAPAITATKKEKDEEKNKVDTGTIDQILEVVESASKISIAIPETQIIETSSLAPTMKKEEELQSSSPEKKVGLLPAKKKSSETAAPHGTEIDFWSEIKAQESVKVSGTPRKVQSRAVSPSVDPRIKEPPVQTVKSPEKLKLDLSKIKTPAKDEDDLKTSLVQDQESQETPISADRDDEKTPLVLEPENLETPLISTQDNQNLSCQDSLEPALSDPSTSLVENLSEALPSKLEERGREGDRGSSIVYNGVEVDEDACKQNDEAPLTQTVDTEVSGTVKKISKWTNHDNLSNLNDLDKDITPVASKEVSPQVSTTSTTTKKKVVKRKKSATPGKKKSEKGENTKTSGKAKKPVKKSAPSPQTSVLKTPMSASGSPRNAPNQRPADLMKMFYTTPAILLTATPRDLRKVRRAKVKRKKPPTRTPSLSSDSTGSTRSTATTSTEEGSNCEEDTEQKRLASTRSNDSGFDGSPRLSNCDMVCHKKCEKLTGNLCGVNQKLVAEALQALKRAPSQPSENQRNADGDHYHHSGRITPPATNLPRFKKYEVTDFNFLKVLGKGSFGKVLLAELRGTECVYAVKCLKKDVVLEDDDVECTLIERKVLTLATRHPYLCHLFCTFQTESHLFFVMEYLNGGDLMFHIQKSGRFSEQRAKFYAAEIWSGLIFLHKKGIVYRDLKLDNVLLDFEGHIRIADFGMCKLQIFLDRTADTFCGTPDYMAPEIIKGLKYNQAVDWWSFGVLLYEMLTGQSPFSGCDEDELFWSICNERPFIPRYLSQSSTDILVCLLEKDAGKRIPGHEIASHPFFCTITWDKLERRQLEAPFKPAVEHTLDTRYFDTAFTAERPRLTPVPDQILTSMDQEVFRGFSYTNPNATD